MTPLSSLWLPILLSAVAVFVLSSIVHMATPWHKNDYAKAPGEAKLMDAVHSLGIPPGDYMVPCPSSRQEASSPEFALKVAKGPTLVMTVMPPGPMGKSLARSLALWFLYLLFVALSAAYVASRALAVGAAPVAVLRFAGATAFFGFSVALWQTSIWYRRSWLTTLRSTIDGLVYAIVTGLILGWLWPR